MNGTHKGNIPYFDGHCDTVQDCTYLGRALRENEGHLDLERLGRFRKAAQVFAIFANKARYPEGTMFAQCEKQHGVFVRELEKNADIVCFCRTGEDILAANAAGKVAALLSIEGGELLDSDPGKLELAASWGVKLINITWNYANGLSGSNAEYPERGLTDTGKAFVKEANRLGILMDVSHLSDPGFWDLAEITDKPIVASHSNARSLCGHSRNVTDDMFRAIRDSGGTVGINMYTDFIGGTCSLDDFVRHVDHFMELDGAKTVALGGDWDGCELSFGFHGIEDVPQLWDALAKRGYDNAVLEDIFYNNLLRVLG